MAGDHIPVVDDDSLAELVRQAELRLSAQTTVILGTHQRAVTLTGLLFAVLAALAGVFVSQPEDSPFMVASFVTALPLTLSVIFCGVSSSFIKLRLPGMVYDRHEFETKKNVLEEALVEYREAHRSNTLRMFFSLWTLRVGLVFAAAAIASGGLSLYNDYRAAQETARLEGVAARGGADDGSRDAGGRADVAPREGSPVHTFSFSGCAYVQSGATMELQCRHDPSGVTVKLRPDRTLPASRR